MVFNWTPRWHNVPMLLNKKNKKQPSQILPNFPTSNFSYIYRTKECYIYTQTPYKQWSECVNVSTQRMGCFQSKTANVQSPDQEPPQPDSKPDLGILRFLFFILLIFNNHSYVCVYLSLYFYFLDFLFGLKG